MLDFTFLFIVLFCMLLGMLRGMIKEFFGFMGIVIAATITYFKYDFFSGAFGLNATPALNFISGIAVFISCMIFVLLANGWIMFALRPVRLGMIDRTFGMFFGLFKGAFFCYIAFAFINIFYYSVVYDKENAKKMQSKDYYLPVWVKSSATYPFLLGLDGIVNSAIPKKYYQKIEDLGKSFANKLEKEQVEALNKKDDDLD